LATTDDEAMNRLPEILEQFTLPEISTLLRRVALSALGAGIVVLGVASLLGYFFFGLGVFIGLGLGLINMRMITSQTAKVTERQPANPIRALASLTLLRLAIVTAVIIVLAIVAHPLGFGAAGGAAFFYLVFVANVVVSLLRKGAAV
jgi:hypothetical protein